MTDQTDALEVVLSTEIQAAIKQAMAQTLDLAAAELKDLARDEAYQYRREESDGIWEAAKVLENRAAKVRALS